MTARALIDVELDDMARNREFMTAVQPGVEAAKPRSARLVVVQGVA